MCCHTGAPDRRGCATLKFAQRRPIFRPIAFYAIRSISRNPCATATGDLYMVAPDQCGARLTRGLQRLHPRSGHTNFLHLASQQRIFGAIAGRRVARRLGVGVPSIEARVISWGRRLAATLYSVARHTTQKKQECSACGYVSLFRPACQPRVISRPCAPLGLPDSPAAIGGGVSPGRSGGLGVIGAGRGGPIGPSRDVVRSRRLWHRRDSSRRQWGRPPSEGPRVARRLRWLTPPRERMYPPFRPF